MVIINLTSGRHPISRVLAVLRGCKSELAGQMKDMNLGSTSNAPTNDPPPLSQTTLDLPRVVPLEDSKIGKDKVVLNLSRFTLLAEIHLARVV